MSKTSWRHIIAFTIRACNSVLWVREHERDIWHKLDQRNKYRTTCGTQVKYPTAKVTCRLETPVEEARQCIICQYELAEPLQLLDLPSKPRKSKPTKPKPPTRPGPPTDYRPNPPAGALEVPIAIAA